MKGTALHTALRPCLTAGVVVGAGLIAVTPAAPPAPEAQHRAVRLVSVDTADSALGAGTALIVGPSFISTPSPAYADLFDSLYLAPRGFTGGTQILTTPEGLYPFSGPFTEQLDPSLTQGQQVVDAAVLKQIADGHVDAANPVVVTGYSQSSIIASHLMSQLQSQGVPSDDVHFVLVGDESIPNGGILERFDLPAGAQPTISSLGLTFTSPGSDDLYPTDVYTNEYDGFADFPQYPIDPLSDLNAILGIAFEHLAYLGLTPQQIQDAIQLPTTAADTLTNYYMIPDAGLPLLDPLQLIPYIGKPLYDLLEPDMSVLVNLGYGNVDDSYLGGWSQGDVDVPTTLGFLPDAGVLQQVPQALANGLQQGITDALKDLSDPSNYVYTLPTWAQELVTAAKIVPGTTFTGVVPTTAQDLFDTFPPHTGLPPVDVASALLVTLPQLDYNVFTSELADGNLTDAIGIPLSADVGIVPLALLGALIPIPL